MVVYVNPEAAGSLLIVSTGLAARAAWSRESRGGAQAGNNRCAISHGSHLTRSSGRCSCVAPRLVRRGARISSRPVTPVAPVRVVAPVRTMITAIRAVIARIGSAIVHTGADRPTGLPPAAAPVSTLPHHRASRLEQDDSGGLGNDSDRRRRHSCRRWSLSRGRRRLRRGIKVGSLALARKQRRRDDRRYRSDCENDAIHNILPRRQSKTPLIRSTLLRCRSY